MTEDEVIIVDKIPYDTYLDIATKAARYALLSIGFTYNRMEKNALLPRINNIVKGKIAEGLFFLYCKTNNITIDTTECTTPFWLPDFKDFLWLGGEWDLKNNYFYCSDSDFLSFNFTLLPALIPNKTSTDQWSKRNVTLIESSRFTAYLFSFIRLLPTNKEYFTIDLSKDQLDFLFSIEGYYKHAPHGEMPFMEKWFFDEMAKKGSETYLRLHYLPEFVITGCANSRYWPLFKNTSVNDPEENYKNFTQVNSWYEPKKEILKFLNGTMATKIKNMTCPVTLLPSFNTLVNKANN